MSHAEYGPFKVGKINFPLALKASTTKSLLEDGDPGIHALRLYCEGVLNTHLGARYAEAAASAALTSAPSVVGVTVPYDPGPYLTVGQLKFPALAIFVTGETMRERTRMRPETTADVVIQWILPPLTAEQALWLTPMLRLVSRVLANRIEQGYDPDHESGAQVFGDADLCSIAVKSSSIGFLPSTALRGSVEPINSRFPCIELSLLMSEVREDVYTEVGIEGIDAGVSVKDDDGEQPLVDVEIPLNGG